MHSSRTISRIVLVLPVVICWITFLGFGALVFGCISVPWENRTVMRTTRLPLEEIHSMAPPAHLDLNNKSRPLLNMTLCRTDCKQNDDCKTYITSVGVCFSSGALFPNDPSWSDGWDIYDEIQSSALHRTIYPTKNETCGGDDHNSSDSFEIPLGICVGPFGLPRPWGSFQLVESVTLSSTDAKESWEEADELYNSAT